MPGAYLKSPAYAGLLLRAVEADSACFALCFRYVQEHLVIMMFAAAFLHFAGDRAWKEQLSIHAGLRISELAGILLIRMHDVRMTTCWSGADNKPVTGIPVGNYPPRV